MTQDIWYAVRLFCRRPVLFGVSIAGLALAIGLAAAAWSIVQGVAFAGYGIRDAASVVRVALPGGVFTPVTGNSPVRGNWAYADYLPLEEAASSVDVVASTISEMAFQFERDRTKSEPVRVMAVSRHYFPVLGFTAAHGRTLGLADFQPGLRPVVVSHGFWKNRLGADPSVVGRTVWLDQRPFAVVGVADRSHMVPSGRGAPPALWTTFVASEQGWTGASRWNPAVDVLARLTPGVTRAQAESQVRTIAAVLARERTGAGAPTEVRLEAIDNAPAGSLFITAVLMTAVGLVVLLACANIANVLLASAAARRREIGTRLALGASRARLVRQLLTESALLGLIAGALGLTAAWAMTPSMAALVQVPPSFDVSPDWSAAVFAVLVALLAGVGAGLVPASHGWRGNLFTALKSDQLVASAPLGRTAIRSLLVAGQAAVSLVLLVVAALLTRALVQNAQLDPGYDVGRLVNASVVYAPEARRGNVAPDATLIETALERVRELPGVSHAALATITPFGGGTATFTVNGRRIHRNETSPAYFDTLGLTVLRGRIYTADEGRAGAPVAVISAALARELWPDGDPIGDTLARVWGPDTVESAKLQGLRRQPPGARVIGVVSDATTDLDGSRPRTVYLPLTDASGARLVVRAESDARMLLPRVREAIAALGPTVRVSAVLAEDGRQRALEGPRILAALALMVGAVALSLAVIGLFGVTAFMVEQRVHEVGVRRALGATSAQLVAMLLRDNLRPVVMGVACGLLLSLLAGWAVEGALYGVGRHDPSSIAAAVLLLLAASAAAVLVPARRASRVDPAQLLKLG